ncbi:hypothetical protein DL89DRAFT_301798 [Linderina pennispora]|uniref:Uncharacterized protein n=1 Tax=Linderina pennispora TaxID=61395 RepID=A0A1Y1W3V7_9FUNG|nr:uncharacterized protein DL89DRAFT_301798 [Linderina pennispora]ORX68219.1 hypothetical protein DL89DRAFT_301798 [Linderina pennispora]
MALNTYLCSMQGETLGGIAAADSKMHMKVIQRFHLVTPAMTALPRRLEALHVVFQALTEIFNASTGCHRLVYKLAAAGADVHRTTTTLYTTLANITSPLSHLEPYTATASPPPLPGLSLSLFSDTATWGSGPLIPKELSEGYKR